VTRDEVFARALELPPADREDFVRGSCDGALHDEILSLLRAHARMGGFLSETAAARLLPLDREAPLGEGDEVASYRIVRTLGSGGSGAVYEAIQAHPQRRVALKVMHTAIASHAARRRFEGEAEILARLQHPGIATVYEAGVHERDGTPVPFFALEYVEGARSLLRYAREQRLDARAKLDLLARVDDAVHHGHQRGIVHLDLKPGNVLVDAAGHPKIIDFGIARAVEERGARGPELMGTLPYMSPEQCTPGADVDVRSDVYALGVVLYELVAGRLPYDLEGAAIAEATRRIREVPPAPLSSSGGDADAIARKALAKDRDRRYASAAALADDLRRHLGHFPVEARSAGVFYTLGKLARRQRAAFVAVLALVAVAFGAAAWSLRLAAKAAADRRDAEFHAYFANLSAAEAALRVGDVAEARQRLEAAPEAYRNWEWRHLRGRLDGSTRTLLAARILYTGAASADGKLLVAAEHLGEAPAALRAWGPAAEGSGDAWRVLWAVEVGTPRIDAVAVNRQRTLVAAGWIEGRAELRDAATGALVRPLEGHGETVNAIDFAPDGDLVATASRDGTVKVWDVATGALLRTLTGHGDRVIGLAFAPGGEALASGGREGTIRIWEVATGATVRVLHSHEGSVEAVAWSPDGTRLVSGSRDETVRLWDPASGECLAVGRGHTGNVRDVSYAPDGATVASASYDRTLRLWDGGSLKALACLRGHESVPKRVAFLSTTTVASFAGDKTVKLWDARRRDETHNLRGHQEGVMRVGFLADGTRLLSWSTDGTLRLWDRAGRREIARPAAALEQIDNAVVSPDGTLAFVQARGAVHAVSLADGGIAPVDVPNLGHAVFAPGAGALFVAFDGRIHRCAVGSRTRARPMPLPVGTVSAIAASTDGRTVVIGDQHGQVGLVDGTTLELRASRRLDVGISALAIDQTDRLVAVGAGEGTCLLLDTRSLDTRATLQGHGDVVRALAFSPDGSRLASASADSMVRIWEVLRGRPLLVLHGHAQGVSALAWSPDGSCIASGDGFGDVPGVIRLWSDR